MNHPDPIIETRNRYHQTCATLAATRDQLARARAEVRRLEESIAALDLRRDLEEDAYTAALNAPRAVVTCQHCGREYEAHDVPSHCSDDCPGFIGAR